MSYGNVRKRINISVGSKPQIHHSALYFTRRVILWESLLLIIGDVLLENMLPVDLGFLELFIGFVVPLGVFS